MSDLMVTCKNCGKHINRITDVHFMEATGYVYFRNGFDYQRYAKTNHEFYCKDCAEERMIELKIQE